VKFAVRVSVARRLRNEVYDAAVHVRAVLRTVWSTQDFDRFQTRRLDQTEERADAAALRARRVAHAVNKDCDVAAG
jgi:hypothetical protein